SGERGGRRARRRRSTARRPEHRDDEVHVVVSGEHRGRVAADRHEGAVADRDLSRVAGEDVEAEHPDEEDPDLRHEGDVVGAEEEREHREHSSHAEQRGEGGETSHTRRTSRCPKRPDGLIRSTTMSTAKANGSCSSDVIAGTYCTMRLSVTPMIHPPTNAPVR